MHEEERFCIFPREPLGVWERSGRGGQVEGEFPGLKKGSWGKEGAILVRIVDPGRVEQGAVELLEELNRTQGNNEVPASE